MIETVNLAGQWILQNSPDLVGFLMPSLVDYLNKEIYGDNEKALIAILSCVLAATLLNWTKLLYGSPQEVLISFGLIFTESQLTYQFYFKNSLVRSKLQSLYLDPQG